MKRFTTTWMTAIASAILLALPSAGAAQTPPPSNPPATAQPPATASSEARADATGDQAAAQEHLRQASAALDEVKTATLPARAKTQVAELKRRLNALERNAGPSDKASATGEANRRAGTKNAKAKAGDNWGTEVAAIDKVLTTLLGPENTTGATPSATGTSGTTPPSARNRAAAGLTLDAETQASLIEVRKHVTAYATAMAGGKTDTDRTEPAASTPPSAAPAAPPSATPPTAPQPPTSDPSATQPPATPPAQPTDPTTPPAQQTDPTTTAPTSAQTTPTDTEARRHLTEARNTLSALTQLPAAAQLSGEARTQVAQLISNFNELITTQSEWRGSYAKVNANLTSLLGPESSAPDPASATGTAGAVGTSGTASATLDPAVREKLVELRRHLSAFESAAGGTTTATRSDAAADMTSSPTGATSATAPTAPPDTTRPATSSATTPSTPPTTPTQTTEPTQGTTGTSGTADAATGNAEIMRHVAAIETLLKMQDDSGGLTLTKAQVEQLRTHWTALRQALDKK